MPRLTVVWLCAVACVTQQQQQDVRCNGKFHGRLMLRPPLPSARPEFGPGWNVRSVERLSEEAGRGFGRLWSRSPKQGSQRKASALLKNESLNKTLSQSRAQLGQCGSCAGRAVASSRRLGIRLVSAGTRRFEQVLCGCTHQARSCRRAR